MRVGGIWAYETLIGFEPARDGAMALFWQVC